MPMIDVLDSAMYYESYEGTGSHQGTGTPFVFLHGNPTSSHLWRHVLPAVGGGRRLLAPDLIGMGRSGKPEITYGYGEQARYLEAWCEALGLDEVVLVGTDWGGSLAFDLAARHPGRVRGVAFMETILRPMAWAEFPEKARDRWRAFRTPGVGEELVLEKNLFIEDSFTQTVLTGLAEADLDAYRAPFPTPESRRPMLEWARAMPLDGEPAQVVARIEEYGKWLAASPEVPKLLLTFEGSPTLMIDGPTAEWCAEHISALTTVACGPAGHQAPEDRPQEIAEALTAWADLHGLG
ncbi:haloalkane dehalogenase [Streptomyces sp. NBC_00094]|uniref:haloalkane dehalogenase n=1 Tax=Streptomyces sp. NBC_00094 TaxID=2903620 RepID=UPI002259E016|nr:haloalkane dehalogenase [Streptomyces sp. NBC_00094]MCX5391635.1 haloalkane dehalogenase [Streptomyces sp. NBC_00094]